MSIDWKRLRLLLIAALAGLALSACRGGDGDDDDGPRREAASAPAGGEAAAEPAANNGAEADDDDERLPSRVQTVGGLPTVRLSAEAQAQTGVRTRVLEAGMYQAQLHAPAVAVDVQPLLQLRSRYNAARGEREAARAASTASAKEVERLRALHADDGNVSLRQLQEAEAAAAADAARLATATRSIDDLRREAELQWGERLARAVLADGDALLSGLVARRDALVLVSLPQGAAAAPAAVRLGIDGERGKLREARLVSAALQTDPLSQGETWYYRAPADGLRVGMRLDAWVPAPGGARRGVTVPRAAVIWYADRPWVYLQTEADRFVRKPLPPYEENDDGWFVAEGLAAGDRVVVSGAQMLFSEEFRARIPSEDEGP